MSAINNVVAEKQTLKNLQSVKKTTKDLVIDFLRLKSNRFKTEPGYTEAIGRDLGILSKGDHLDPLTYAPIVKAAVYPKYIEVSFTKKGVDGVNVYRRMKGEAKWHLLAYDKESPYHDTQDLADATKPEVREYMCIGVIGDEEFGKESSAVTAVFDGIK